MTMSEQENCSIGDHSEARHFTPTAKAVTPVSQALTLRFGHWGCRSLESADLSGEIDDNSQIGREQI